MTHVYSKPVDDLVQSYLDSDADDRVIASTDIVIVGSGYGASVAARQLAGLKKTDDSPVEVVVLERGKEYAIGEFPDTLGDMPGHVRFQRPSDTHPTGNPDGLFELRSGDDLDILVGNGLGGGSLINANVAARPAPEILEAWPDKYRGTDFDQAIADIETWLGATTDMPTPQKYDTLQTLADAMNVPLQPANITVTHGPDNGSSLNAVEIQQHHCTRCGNCVTGCNVGAKNTLMMNLIPLAAERGASFITGANVLHVDSLNPEHPDQDVPLWRVCLQRTHAIRTPLENEHFFIDARYVVLAAGAVGSTEILLRSEDLTEVQTFSERLGQGFSTNGDGVGFSFGQAEAVNAIGTSQMHSNVGPGPTITGIVQAAPVSNDGVAHHFTLEDGAIPAAITKLFGELVTTGAELGRITNNELPAWFAGQAQRFDPLAYNRPLLDHGQVFLMMSDDTANRRLSLSADGNAAFPDKLADAHYDAANVGLRMLDGEFADHNLKDGFGGGQYVANPAWKLLPDSASSVLSGNLPGGRNLTVHPLGGCGMGVDVAAGVVNEDGQVFNAAGGVHQGLYVTDGSILPTSLATNPFLTISAVAKLCCDALLSGPLAGDGWSVAPARPDTVVGAPVGTIVPHDNRAELSANLILREQLVGQFSIGDLSDAERQFVEGVIPDLPRLADRNGVIVRIRLRPFDVHQQLALVANGDAVYLPACVELYVNGQSARMARKRRTYGAPGDLDEHQIIARGTAEIALLHWDFEEDKVNSRARKALRAFLKRRGWGSFTGDESDSELGIFEQLTGFWRTAQMHANYRQFIYFITVGLPDTENAGNPTIELVGRKKIRWQKNRLRVWDSLLNLPLDLVRVTANGQHADMKGHLKVDAGYMLDEGLIQVDDSMDMAESAMSAISFLAFFTRCLLQPSFWEFGAPDYPVADLKNKQAVPALKVSAIYSVNGESFPFQVPERTPENVGDVVNMLDLELTRYAQEAADAQPVLLVHGLAQGSGIYNSPHMNRNMASYFYNEGYDVWLLDYRLSNRFNEQQIPYRDEEEDKDKEWAIDAIGEHDIPAAVERVYDESGMQVKIFAHCVGAIGVQMAILNGKLVKDGGNMVESVCFNAIHPWIVPAASNLVRSKLGALTRAWVSDELLDPILQTKDKLSPAQSVVDRLAFSFARISEDEYPGYADKGIDGGDLGHGKKDAIYRGICDRMTFLYSRMWRHENLENTLKRNWLDIVGRAPLQVYQQLYYILAKERILDDNGQNVYLTEDKIKANWRHIPTFFLHGELSDVFNPQSATRSAARLNHALRTGEAGGDPFAPVFLHRVDDYGHMDPILAEHAHERVYPKIHRFFENGRAWLLDPSTVFAPFDPISLDDDPDWPAETEPTTGQILRAAWIEGSEIRRRYWVEKYRFNTSPTEGVTAIGMDPAEVIHLPNLEEEDGEWFEWLDGLTPPGEYQEPVIISDIKDGAVLHIMVPETLFASPSLEGMLFELSKLASEGLASGDLGLRGGTGPGGGIRLEAEGFEGGLPEVALEDQPPYFRRLVRRMNGDAGAGDTFHFLVCSCRYPGTPIERHQSDEIFVGMQRRIEEEEFDVAMFVGDQIYADAYNDVFDDGLWRDRYYGGYRAAFNSRHMSQFLRLLPIHFAMDDHEIVDNWSGGIAGQVTPSMRSSGGPQLLTYAGIKQDQVDFAYNAARAFMSSAREKKRVGTAPKPPMEAMWYSMDHEHEVNFPCFVLDTRSQRMMRALDRYANGAIAPTMIDEAAGEQLEALLHWLTSVHGSAATTGRPKFIFSGQILAPVVDDLRDNPSIFRREDGFFGYPHTLQAIISHIADNQITDVVFVGGDLHISCAAELTLSSGGNSVTAWQIVASGLYSPMPFANSKPDHYTWLHEMNADQAPQMTVGDADVSLRYRAELLTDDPSHFVQVLVDPAPAASGLDWRIAIRAFDRSGSPIALDAGFDRQADHTQLVFG